MRLARIAALAALILAAAALSGVGLPRAAESATEGDGRTITVTGLGSVTATPDRAELSFGVETRAPTARAALAANAASMRKVLAALRAAGLGAADLRTQQVSIFPVAAPEGGAIDGYAATNTVAARITDLSRIAAVIDAGVGAGANQLFGPTLTRSNADALYRQALAGAVEDARAKAQALAAASGLALGAVRTVVEGAGASPMPLAADAAARASEGGAPVEPGTQEIQASATVTFAAG